MLLLLLSLLLLLLGSAEDCVAIHSAFSPFKVDSETEAVFVHIIMEDRWVRPRGKKKK